MDELRGEFQKKLEGEKAAITIKNYIGGEYFFTCDEAEIHDDEIYLIEGKHTEGKMFPSTNDIQDGLLKMMPLTNLQDVKVGDQQYKPVPILKLTSEHPFRMESLSYEELDEDSQLNLRIQDCCKSVSTLSDIGRQQCSITRPKTPITSKPS